MNYTLFKDGKLIRTGNLLQCTIYIANMLGLHDASELTLAEAMAAGYQFSRE